MNIFGKINSRRLQIYAEERATT